MILSPRTHIDFFRRVTKKETRGDNGLIKVRKFRSTVLYHEISI